MRLIVFLFVVQYLLVPHAQATTRLPDFTDYPATGKYSGKPAKLDAASHAYARRFRSILSGELQHGPNFAGHYVLTSLGCGSSCEAMAIVDANSGRVMVPEELESIMHNLPCDRPLVEFRLESSLLKLFERNGEEVVTRYLVWDLAAHPERMHEILASRKSIYDFCR